MEPKTQLLVFNRKEITVIIVLFVLVALFSFTLGLRIGKSLGVAKAQPQEVTPLVEKKAEPAVASAEHPATEEKAAPEEPKENEVKETPDAQAKAAEDRADEEFKGETAKGKVGLEKKLPMAYPAEKRGEGSDGVRYTLQVGSHRTVAEATEQVATLKRNDLQAFYLEAKVKGKGTWYRVGVGTFATKEEAEQAGVKWKSAKVLPSYIVQKINE